MGGKMSSSNITPATTVVAYGTANGIGAGRPRLAAAAADLRLAVIAWHADSDADGDGDAADRPGLARALGACLRHRAPLWLAEPAALRSFDQLRDTAALLDQHGLYLIRGAEVFAWNRVVDLADAAVRSAVSRVHRLRHAV